MYFDWCDSATGAACTVTVTSNGGTNLPPAVGGGVSATFSFASTPTISTIAMTSCIVSPSTGTSGLTGCAVTTGGSLTVTGGNFYGSTTRLLQLLYFDWLWWRDLCYYWYYHYW